MGFERWYPTWELAEARDYPGEIVLLCRVLERVALEQEAFDWLMLPWEETAEERRAFAVLDRFLDSRATLEERYQI